MNLPSLLKREWRHLETMPTSTFWLLLVPTLLCLWIDPLLPIAAACLQLWAGASALTWRDRWASIFVWAKQGIWFVGLLSVCIWLVALHIWIFPTLLTAVRTFWQAHLWGDFSLSPLDGRGLLARTLFFLPLAPPLAILYEWIDPRTQILRRVLRSADLMKASPAAPPPPEQQAAGQQPSPAEQQEAAPVAAQTQTPPASPAPPSPTQPKKQPSARQHTPASAPPEAEQLTIESFLATEANDPPPVLPPSSAQQSATPPAATPTARGGKRKRTKKRADEPSTPPSSSQSPDADTKTDINWDEVVE
jgi:hypothetical protein